MPIEQFIRTKRGKMRQVKLTPLAAIKLHCLECVGWSPKEVDSCVDHHCPNYHFRKGTNPSRKGIGGGKNGHSSGDFDHQNQRSEQHQGRLF